MKGMPPLVRTTSYANLDPSAKTAQTEPGQNVPAHMIQSANGFIKNSRGMVSFFSSNLELF
jgi:hypothetical protein